MTFRPEHPPVFDPELAAAAARQHVRGGRFDMDALLADRTLGRSAIVSSFGIESAVALHLALTANPGLPIIFIDTGRHFAETLAYRDTLMRLLPINNWVTVGPEPEVISGIDPDGGLHASDPDLCCTARKVFPLDAALAGIDSWLTGRKRFHGATRAELPLAEIDGARLKLNPMANWTPGDVEAYRLRNGLPAHPLAARGYGSIGCSTCTRPLAPGESLRDGRWSGTGKTECGIHRPAARAA